MCKPTPRVRNLMEAARAEARRRGDRHLGTEQLLLAMLGDQGGIAGQVLRERADPERLRAGVDEALASARAASGADPDLPELAAAERLPSAGVTGPYIEIPVEDMDRVGFEVLDVDEACAAVVVAGGRVVGPADHLGRVVVADPEGIPLTLAPWRADPYAITEPAFLELVESALTAKGALCVAQVSYGGPDDTWFVIETMDQLCGVLARGRPSERFRVSTKPWRPLRGRADDPALLREALRLVKRREDMFLAAGVGEGGELVDAEE